MIRIREANGSDINEIIPLLSELTQREEVRSPKGASFVEEYLLSPSNKLLLAEVEEGIAGFLSYSLRLDLWHMATCCFIEDLVVKTAFRGRGIGTGLIQHVLEMATREKFAEISLTVSKDNVGAQKLYKRLGLDEEVLCLAKHLHA